jgi:hypothetical protein
MLMPSRASTRIITKRCQPSREVCISGFEGSDGAVNEQDVFKSIVTGRRNAGAFVDFSGVEEVEDGEAKYGKDLVHPLKAEATLAIEEVGDVRLLEISEVREFEAGELTGVDPGPEELSQIVLKRAESHGL